MIVIEYRETEAGSWLPCNRDSLTPLTKVTALEECQKLSEIFTPTQYRAVQELSYAEIDNNVEYIDRLIGEKIEWAHHIGATPEVDDLYAEVKRLEADGNIILTP